jgi:hypothetical protein
MEPSAHGKKSLLTDTWILEIVSNSISVLSLISIAILLSRYDEKPLVAWHGVGLNALVAVFSTISKTLLLFAVSSCLGQWAYLNFAQKRSKLIDFDTFVSASQGPQGSFFLLLQTRFR